MKNTSQFMTLAVCWFLIGVDVVLSKIDSNELIILKEFRSGLENPDLLKWPDNDDLCDKMNRLEWVNCYNGRVIHITVPGMGLIGALPPNLDKLAMLRKIDLHNNGFFGALPSFSGLSYLYFAAFDHNNFSSIPEFDGLLVLKTLLLDYNNFNATTGWMFTKGLEDSPHLMTLSCRSCNLVGPLPGFIGSLFSLKVLRLSQNNLSGKIPTNWTNLPLLEELDLTDNNISSPIPKFGGMVRLYIEGNRLVKSPNNDTHGLVNGDVLIKKSFSSTLKVAIIVSSCACTLALIVIIALCIYWKRKKLTSQMQQTSEIIVASSESSSTNINVIEYEKIAIPFDVLQKSTNNFAPDNEIGRGSFGVVYKGELDNKKKIAVKKMEAAKIMKESLNEFQVEIDILSRVRHCHLMSLLGYCTEGNERILVYKYMSQGALSKHLFHWKTFGLEPLSWKKRLSIALDVARGMEYLHSLAHQRYIHRDLKSANILLDDDFRARVSDFGMVKIAPDGGNSVVTRIVGTFGYIAPEYAMTGKVTTKADIFSFGVVLMELLTGLKALDEKRSEERQILVDLFRCIRLDKEKLKTVIDPTLDMTESTFESISIVANLANHCTRREHIQRPDMSHVVSILAPQVYKWKPLNYEVKECSRTDCQISLMEMLKTWRESEGEDTSSQHSKFSIPSMPIAQSEDNKGKGLILS